MADKGAIIYDLKLRLDRALKDLKAMSREAREAHRDIHKLGGVSKDITSQFRKLATTQRQLARDTKKAATGLRAMAKAAHEAADGTRKAGEGAKGAGAGARGAAGGFRAMAGGMMGLLAGVAVIQQVKEGVRQLTQVLADNRNELADSATRTGLSPETIKALKAAAEGAGDSLDKLLPSLKQFPKRLADAQRGAGELAPVLKALRDSGIEVEGGLEDADTALVSLLEALQEVPDPAARAALATKAFGEAGGDLLVAFGNTERFQAFNDLTRQFGTRTGPDATKAAGDWQLAVSALRVAVDDVREQLAAAFGGSGAQMLIGFGGSLISLTSQGIAGMKLLGEGVYNALGPLRALLSTGKGVLAVFKGLGAGLRGDFDGVRAASQELKASLDDAFTAAGDALAGNVKLALEAPEILRTAREQGIAAGQAFVDAASGTIETGGRLQAPVTGSTGPSSGDLFDSSDKAAEEAAKQQAEAAAAAKKAWLDMARAQRAALQSEGKGLREAGTELKRWGDNMVTEIERAEAAWRAFQQALVGGLASLAAGDLAGGINGALSALQNPDAIARLSGGGKVGQFLASGAGQAALGGVGVAVGVAQQVGAAGQQFNARRRGLKEQLSAAEAAGDAESAKAIREELAKLDRQIEKYGSASGAAIAQQLKGQIKGLLMGLEALPSLIVKVLIPSLIQAAPSILAELVILLIKLPFILARAIIGLPKALVKGFRDAWRRIRDDIRDALNIFDRGSGDSGPAYSSEVQEVLDERKEQAHDPYGTRPSSARTSAPARRLDLDFAALATLRASLPRRRDASSSPALTTRALDRASGGGARRALSDQRRDDIARPAVVMKTTINTVVADRNAVNDLQRLTERGARTFKAQQGGF